MSQVDGFADKVGFIWGVADDLRGDYKAHEYGNVILPLVVLRRLDCVLEPTKAAVVARAASLSPTWLFYALRSTFMLDQIRLGTTFSAQPGIYLGSLSALRVPLPSRDEQDISIARLETMSVRRLLTQELLGRSGALLEERKQSLITAAVSGEFDVSAAAGRGVLV